MTWDVFLSHASEDKPFVHRLARGLTDAGLRVWYDDFALKSATVSGVRYTGLRDSRYGVVILSPNFFRKEWPQKELDGLTARDDGKSKVILPVWYNVTADDVRRFSPPLADKLSIFYGGSVKGVISKLVRAIQRDRMVGLSWQATPIELAKGIGAVLLPVRPVRGFALCVGRFPITNLLYESFVTSIKYREPIGEHFVNDDWTGPFKPWSDPAFSHPAKPVVCVDFWDAVSFCEWATSERAPVFLPTAEIWDYVATEARFGSSVRAALRDTDRKLIHHKSTAPAPIASDGSRDGSLGVSDVFGNVWEWCGGNAHEQEFEFVGLLGRNRSLRMEAELRGGGFLDDLDLVHPMLRSGILEDGTSTRHSDLGFRVCAAVEVKESVPSGVASLLDTMPALPSTVWELALNASEYYQEARYSEHRRRRYEDDV